MATISKKAVPTTPCCLVFKTNLIVLCLHFNFSISPFQSFNAHFPFTLSHSDTNSHKIIALPSVYGNTNTSYKYTLARTHPLFQHFPLDCSSMCLCCLSRVLFFGFDMFWLTVYNPLHSLARQTDESAWMLACLLVCMCLYADAFLSKSMMVLLLDAKMPSLERKQHSHSHKVLHFHSTEWNRWQICLPLTVFPHSSVHFQYNHSVIQK